MTHEVNFAIDLTNEFTGFHNTPSNSLIGLMSEFEELRSMPDLYSCDPIMYVVL